MDVKIKKSYAETNVRFFNVDPTGLAPASPCGNSGMLRTYTTGPGPRVYAKIEKVLLQGLFLCHTDYARSFTNIRCFIPLYQTYELCQYLKCG